MINIEIRRAKTSELSVVQKLYLALCRHEKLQFNQPVDLHWPNTNLSRKYHRQAITSPKGFLWVAADKEEVVGYANGWIIRPPQWRKQELIAELYMMFVIPKYRGQGIGKKLLISFAVWAKQKKVKRLKLIVTDQNTRALKLYHKLGYKAFERILERDI